MSGTVIFLSSPTFILHACVGVRDLDVRRVHVCTEMLPSAEPRQTHTPPLSVLSLHTSRLHHRSRRIAYSHATDHVRPCSSGSQTSRHQALHVRVGGPQPPSPAAARTASAPPTLVGAHVPKRLTQGGPLAAPPPLLLPAGHGPARRLTPPPRQRRRRRHRSRRRHRLAANGACSLPSRPLPRPLPRPPPRPPPLARRARRARCRSAAVGATGGRVRWPPGGPWPRALPHALRHKGNQRVRRRGVRERLLLAQRAPISRLFTPLGDRLRAVQFVRRRQRLC